LDHGSGSGQLDLGRVGFWVEHYRVFGFQVISGWVGFQVLSSSSHLGSGSGQVSDHLISDNLGFRVISVGPGLIGSDFFCYVLFQVRLDFELSDFNFFS
jgi:hypothetical protein